jgi:Holliday junction DNA helicase RuvA
MIAQLIGRVEHLDASGCVIDVNGVGYLVQASTRTLSALPPPPATARILLYGFADAAERDWFRLLTTVQGVGAKVALSILSGLSPRDLIAAIATGDKSALTRVPGVGPKLAIRLLTELHEKAGAMPSGLPTTAPAPTGVASDVVSALGNLGYRRAETQPIVERLMQTLGPDAALDVVLRAALKDLAPR